MTHLIRSTARTAFILIALWLLAYGYGQDTPRVVEMNGPAMGTPSVVSPTDTARAYAVAHGMSSCGDPARAHLDDVVLALPAGEDGLPSSSVVTVLSFDEALDSAGEYVNVLACNRGSVTQP